MSQRDDFVAYLRWLVDVKHIRYDNPASESRCTPETSGFADCSGFVVAGERHVGIPKPCITSFGFAQEGHAANSGMSLELARDTKGALLIIGQDEGQGGSHGHIEVSLGDGVHTVGARNHLMGVGYFTIDSLPWSYCCRPVGMTGFDTPGSTGPKPQPVKEAPPVTTVAAPNAGGTARAIPGLKCVMLYGNAKCDGDKASGADRIWQTKDGQASVDSILIDIAAARDGKGFWALYDLGGHDIRSYFVPWR